MWYVLYSPSTCSFLTHDGFGQLTAARLFSDRIEAEAVARCVGVLLDAVPLVRARRSVGRM